MSTNWFHDFFFGSNESAIEALDKLQKMDAEQFQKVFSALEELQKGQQFNAEQIQVAFSRLEELQKGQLFNAEQIQSMQEHLNSLQERLAGVEEKVGTLTETVADHGSNIADLTDTVGDQGKIMLTCCIVTSVIAVAAISFIGFCIYQGIKSEREKQKGLSQNVPTGELIDLLEPDTKLLVDVNSTEKLPENTSMMPD
ncbi:MAG: hypothetical protein PG978_000873 [Wolbachia endosymbiont of Ctenocephalides felis wCfeF]|nr:MAG: hypothetical protein PG978_000873 [Wolbachia endosymbiont of Ctenocephalides felis wCfeF]